MSAHGDYDDNMLAIMLAYIDDGTVGSLPITLCAGGLLVTGELVNHATFFTGWAEQLHAATASSAAIYTAGDPPPSAGFIHLRSATVVSGGDRVQLKWWRGRLSDISAWSLEREVPGGGTSRSIHSFR